MAKKEQDNKDLSRDYVDFIRKQNVGQSDIEVSLRGRALCGRCFWFSTDPDDWRASTVDLVMCMNCCCCAMNKGIFIVNCGSVPLCSFVFFLSFLCIVAEFVLNIWSLTFWHSVHTLTNVDSIVSLVATLLFIGYILSMSTGHHRHKLEWARWSVILLSIVDLGLTVASYQVEIEAKSEHSTLVELTLADCFVTAVRIVVVYLMYFHHHHPDNLGDDPRPADQV